MQEFEEQLEGDLNGSCRILKYGEPGGRRRGFQKNTKANMGELQGNLAEDTNI